MQQVLSQVVLLVRLEAWPILLLPSSDEDAQEQPYYNSCDNLISAELFQPEFPPGLPTVAPRHHQHPLQHVCFATRYPSHRSRV